MKSWEEKQVLCMRLGRAPRRGQADYLSHPSGPTCGPPLHSPQVKSLLAITGDFIDTSSILGSGRYPGGGHRQPLQYSCLVNPMDRGAWWAMVHRVAKSQTRLKRLSRAQHAIICNFANICIITLLKIFNF